MFIRTLQWVVASLNVGTAPAESMAWDGGVNQVFVSCVESTYCNHRKPTDHKSSCVEMMYIHIFCTCVYCT